jgi:ubiquinone/menaquinone biosynthesis C-methylase UbiE
MKEGYLSSLRCPNCGSDNAFALVASVVDRNEVREGSLACGKCDLRTNIRRGVVELLIDPPDHVFKEADGLARFAEVMKGEGWDRKRVLALPFGTESGYWYVQATSIHQLLHRINFQPGQSILDVGSNTCWASNMFATRGLKTVALDIALTELQGLYTSDWYFEDNQNVYFERVLGSMFNIPIASNSLDYVYCCEVLHHSSPNELPITFSEIYRVLKPGGKLLVINEPLKFPTNLKRDHGQEVAAFSGNENVYFLHNYTAAARRAGFRPKFLEPKYHPLFREEPMKNPALETLRRAAAKSVAIRQLATTWLFAFGGGPVALNMVCTKPS